MEIRELNEKHKKDIEEWKNKYADLLTNTQMF